MVGGEGNAGGGDGGKRQQRTPINSHARLAYVCRFSNSAAHGDHVTGLAAPFDSLRTLRGSWLEEHGQPLVFIREKCICEDTEALIHDH